MAKTINLFPNYVFEGTLQIDSTVKNTLRKDLIKDLDSGKAQKMNFGSITDREIPLENSFQQLAFLMGNTFINHAKKQFLDVKTEVDILNPYIVSIKPDHSYPINMESCRWYNGCCWLQSTNKGSHLYLEDFSIRTYADRHRTQKRNFSVAPRNFKYIFWPSHIPWGFTPNQSMVDTQLLCLSFLVSDRKGL